MPRNNNDREVDSKREYGFKQSHGGRERFPGGEWEQSSEFGKNSEYRESDSFDRYSVGGVTFDRDRNERDDEFRSREYNRSRFADTGYAGKGPKGYKRSDERIRDEACDALYRNTAVDASDIEVSVADGHLILTGTVESRFAKREAERCVEFLPGVFDVHNELKLKATN